MASIATQLTRSNLCLAFRLPGATSDSEAWKKMMGDKPVCARLDTLPEAKPRWSALFTSAIFQVVLTAVLIIVPRLFPDQLVNKDAYEAVSIMAPQTEVALPPEEVVSAKLVRTLPPVEEPLQPQRVPKLIAPRPSV